MDEGNEIHDDEHGKPAKELALVSHYLQSPNTVSYLSVLLLHLSRISLHKRL